jgi:hypothetical protein
MLCAAQTHRDLQRAFEEALDHEARQAAHNREIRNHGGELGTKLAGELVGQRRLRRGPAGGTLPSMTPVFRDVRLDGRQLRDLMAPRVADVVACVQPVRALTTRLGCELDDHIHALSGHERPMMPRMPRLTAGPAPTLGAATAQPLSARKAIGGRRLRRRRRVLLPEGELTFQIVDLLGLFGDLLRALVQLLAEPLILATQPLKFSRVGVA